MSDTSQKLSFYGTLDQVDREWRATRFSIHQDADSEEVSSRCLPESGSDASSDTHHISTEFQLAYPRRSLPGQRKDLRTESN